MPGHAHELRPIVQALETAGSACEQGSGAVTGSALASVTKLLDVLSSGAQTLGEAGSVR